MTKTITAILGALLLLAPVLATAGPFTEGIKTNPAANTIMADTGGALGAGAYAVMVQCDADAGSSYAVEQRNSANSATLWSQRLSITGPNETKEATYPAIYFDTNERVRVRLVDGMTLATAQCSIILGD